MRKFFGALLVMIGVLIASLTGLCGMMLLEPVDHTPGSMSVSMGPQAWPSVASLLGLPFGVGVAFIVVGAVLFLSGRKRPPSVGN